MFDLLVSLHKHGHMDLSENVITHTTPNPVFEKVILALQRPFGGIYIMIFPFSDTQSIHTAAYISH